MAKLTTYQVTEIAKDTWVINEAGFDIVCSVFFGSISIGTC